LKRKRHKTVERDAAILAEYTRLAGIKDHEVQKYSYEWIVKTLAKKFFLADATIEAIIGS